MELAHGDIEIKALALQVAAREPTIAFLPLSRLPLRGDLRGSDGKSLRVVGLSEAYGFVLLGSPAPPDVVPLRPRREVVTVGAHLRVANEEVPIGVIAHGAATPHLLTLDAAVVDAVALLDSAGHAAAFSLGDGTALPISPAFAFLAAREPPRPLAEVQRDLRRHDLGLRLADGIEAVETATTVEATRAALEDLELGFGAAREPALVDAYDRALRGAHRLLAQRLARAGRATEGFAHLRRCLDRFLGDVDCLADGVPLAAAAGDLQAAADLWLELRSRARERADGVATQLGDSLLRAGKAAERLDPAGASDILARGVDVLPDRADLRMAFADALLAGGQPHAALDQARIAARIDPRFASQLDGIAKRAETRQAGAVEIPFDPETHVVQARCTLDGVGIDLVVDTGASLTIVPTALAATGSTSKRRVAIQTASGTVEGNLVRFKELKLGTLTVRNVQAVALDLPGSLAGKGLLGMNVLRRLDVQIDSARGVLVIQRAGSR